MNTVPREEGKGMRRSSLAFAIAISLVLAACSGGAPTAGPAAPAAATPEPTTAADISLAGPVQVTIWHNQTGALAKGFDEMIADFNKTNGKGITVKAEFQGNYTQIYQKMLGAIQAGNMPEGVVAVENQVADYAKAGVIVEMDPYINSKKNGLSKESLADIYQPYIDANKYPQYGNRILSFPFIKSLEVNIVNLDLLKELGFSAPPATLEDFEKMARAAKRTDAAGKVTRWGWAGMGTEAFLAQVMSRGGKILNADGTVAWGGPEGVEALRLLERCYAEQFCYRPTGFDWQDRFGEGNLLFATGTSTGRPFIQAAIKKPGGINWAIFGMPVAGSGRSQTIQFGGVIAITKSTDQKQLAVWEFLKWFTDTKQTAKWSVISSYMPVRKTALDDADLKAHWASKDVQGKQAFDLVPTSVAGPSIRGWQEVRDAIFEAITKVNTAKAKPEDALRDAVTKANNVLKENR
jgi:sn-glycerol 3-phosphate transport system substrate-binding protein